MKIYNTLTKRKEEFVPVEPGKVKCMCADRPSTTYPYRKRETDDLFDTVRRYFEYKGYDVNYVSNLRMSMIRSSKSHRGGR